MKIGIIGAGRVGCSIGKYITVNSDLDTITGFYNRGYEKAVVAANFCNTKAFKSLSDLVMSSDTLFITTQDEQIPMVWDCIDKGLIKNKIICHFSGSISSDVFTSIGDYDAYPGSIHPVYAFSSRFDSYKGIKNIFFTIEGHPIFLDRISQSFSHNGNIICSIDKEKKSLYHASLSMASNHLIGLLGASAEILRECGFSESSAYEILKPLMLNNLAYALENGVEKALTGPIERGDCNTVKKHLRVLNSKQMGIYKSLGMEILNIAVQKNQYKPVVQTYSEIEKELLN